MVVRAVAPDLAGHAKRKDVLRAAMRQAEVYLMRNPKVGVVGDCPDPANAVSCCA